MITIQIIGIGNVGSVLASALILKFQNIKIILTDTDSDKLYAEYLDLRDMNCIIGENNKLKMSSNIEECDIYVLCCGKATKNMVNKNNLYEINKEIIIPIVKEISNINPYAWIINASNPTHKISMNCLNYMSKVIPVGIILDNARNIKNNITGSHEEPIHIDSYRIIMEGKGYTNFGVVGEIIVLIDNLLNGI